MKGKVIIILIVNSLSILNGEETFRPWHSGALRRILNDNSSIRSNISFKYAQDPYNKYSSIKRQLFGLANFSDLLDRESFAKSAKAHDRELFHVNSDYELDVQDSEYNIKIDPELSLIKGTLKKKFEKITENSFIPPGTRRVGGKLIENNLQVAR